MYLNQSVKDRIRETGIKQRFLADKLGVDEGAFANILLGRRNCPDELLERLAYELALDVDDVVVKREIPA